MRRKRKGDRRGERKESSSDAENTYWKKQKTETRDKSDKERDREKGKNRKGK